jgi:tryptophanyl-tRNA synthetase
MTILTGVQPNSSLHIGNYFGAILPLVNKAKNLKENDKIFYFSPDLHALSGEVDYKSIYQNNLDNFKILMACGIDPSSPLVKFYRQSSVPAHAQLHWILESFGHFGELSRMTQFKDKQLKMDSNDKSVSVGLFTYPLLMTADILLYDANYIPVGDDQKQHLELARDIAIRINNKFNAKIFTVPFKWEDQMTYFTNTQQGQNGLRIKSLTAPSKKMSKSDYDDKGTIYLNDNPKLAAKKITTATTDSIGIINYDPTNQPGIANLLQILACLTNQSLDQVINKWQGTNGYGVFKNTVALELESFLTSFQSKYNQISNQQIESILTSHEQEINLIANNKIKEVYTYLGFVPKEISKRS